MDISKCYKLDYTSKTVDENLIEDILSCYKQEYVLIQRATFKFNGLFSTVFFSEYPFTKVDMPYISANLINLAIDQVALLHLGYLIKERQINFPIDTITEYVKSVANCEFVTARLQAKYIKPILIGKTAEIRSQLYEIRKYSTNVVLLFGFKCKPFFNISGSFVYSPDLGEYK